MPVYIICTGGDDGSVKIGFTADVTPRRRLAKMQTDNHERLTVLRWLEGDENTEAALQTRYAHLRLRGDWFRFCETMLGEVGVADVQPTAPTPALQWGQQKDIFGLISHAGGMKPLMAKLGVARTTIIDWKRSGTIPANRVAQISEALSLPVNEVVKLAPMPKPRVPEPSTAA